MAISEEQVKHVAKLAKLSFNDEERHAFTDQLGKIIDMVELLEEVDTTGVPLHRMLWKQSMSCAKIGRNRGCLGMN